jgi:hypothetical protein
MNVHSGAGHNAIMTAVKLSPWTQNFCPVLAYNEYFATLLRSTTLAGRYMLQDAILLTVCTTHEWLRGDKNRASCVREARLSSEVSQAKNDSNKELALYKRKFGRDLMMVCNTRDYYIRG